MIIRVYDILGAEVLQLLDEEKEVGTYEISFDAQELTSGTYIYKLQAVPIGRQAGDFVETKKIVLLR